MNKTALVTGASSGIGEATVKQFLRDGFEVYAAARRVDRMKPLAAAGAKLIAMDVTDDGAMVAAVEQIGRETGRLDVLVNNAGYGSMGALEDVPVAEARRQLDVNLFGLARLSQLALPMMRSQKSGKIINVSSIGGKVWQPFGSWYYASKFAVEGLSNCLRVEVKPFGIDVVVIEPGAIKSEWSDIAGDSLVKYSGDTAYATPARNYATALTKVYAGRIASSPEVVAAAIGKAAAARRPKTRYAVGGGAGMVLFIQRILSDRLFDNVVGSQARQSR